MVRPSTLSFRLVLLFAVAAVSAGASPTSQPAGTSTRSSLVTARPGDLPILITAPHGGTTRLPEVPDRTGDAVPRKRGAKTNFSFALDRRTDQLAFAVADAIEKSIGKRPYLVVAHFSRRQIDANRPVEEAVETDDAREVYRQFHGEIAAYRSEILARFGRGLLIDLHGHGGDPEVIYRGTADGQTVRNLVETFGRDSVFGPEGVLAPLEARGLRLEPVGGTDDLENPSLNGGYITRRYGSFAGGSFDAIQLELGASFRAPERIPTFAGELANTLVTAYRRFLSPQEDDHGKSTTRPAASTPDSDR
jgi:N-formylglutamate amidohydrolase